MWGMGAMTRRGALWLAGAVLAGAPALALASEHLPGLSRLELGRWQITLSDPKKAPRSICLRDPVMLVQVEHGPAQCTRQVLAAGASGATVQYRCTGRGYGHTRVIVETPRIARVESQGIVDGRPFSWRAEARRVGAC